MTGDLSGEMWQHLGRSLRRARSPRDQGSPIGETLVVYSWDSSVLGPLSHLSVPAMSVTGG